jgi:hypothetical protein
MCQQETLAPQQKRPSQEMKRHLPDFIVPHRRLTDQLGDCSSPAQIFLHPETGAWLRVERERARSSRQVYDETL